MGAGWDADELRPQAFRLHSESARRRGCTLKIPIEGDLKIGAGERVRTVNIHLGKVVLYQLSYARSLVVMKL